MKTKEVEVKILGKSFTFNIPNNIKSEEFLEIIYFVENKMNKVKSNATDLDSFKLGLRVSINIAEEYFSLLKENEKLRVVLNRITKMISPDEEGNQVPISFSSS